MEFIYWFFMARLDSSHNFRFFACKTVSTSVSPLFIHQKEMFWSMRWFFEFVYIIRHAVLFEQRHKMRHLLILLLTTPSTCFYSIELMALWNVLVTLSQIQKGFRGSRFGFFKIADILLITSRFHYYEAEYANGARICQSFVPILYSKLWDESYLLISHALRMWFDKLFPCFWSSNYQATINDFSINETEHELLFCWASIIQSDLMKSIFSTMFWSLLPPQTSVVFIKCAFLLNLFSICHIFLSKCFCSLEIANLLLVRTKTFLFLISLLMKDIFVIPCNIQPFVQFNMYLCYKVDSKELKISLNQWEAIRSKMRTIPTYISYYCRCKPTSISSPEVTHTRPFLIFI